MLERCDVSEPMLVRVPDSLGRPEKPAVVSCVCSEPMEPRELLDVVRGRERKPALTAACHEGESMSSGESPFALPVLLRTDGGRTPTALPMLCLSTLVPAWMARASARLNPIE